MLFVDFELYCKFSLNQAELLVFFDNVNQVTDYWPEEIMLKVLRCSGW